MFASACKIYDSYNDKELRKIKETIRESSSWSHQMKSGRHLSRVVTHNPEVDGSVVPSMIRSSRHLSILERESSLRADCFEASQQVLDSWKNRFAGCGAELSSDHLRRSLQDSSEKKPRVFRELQKAMESVTEGNPIVSDAILQNLPLTEAEIKRQSLEKYQKVSKVDLRNFLVDCHEKALREKNHIKINWKLEEVYRVKEDTFLKKLQIQSSRYYKQPKEPFIADPRKQKTYKGIKVEWRSKPSSLQTFRSTTARKTIQMKTQESAQREPLQTHSQQSHREPPKIRLLDQQVLLQPKLVLLASKPFHLVDSDKQTLMNKTVSTSLNPATLTLSIPQAASVREFSLNHLLDGQLPRKSFVFDPSNGPQLAPKETHNKSRLISSRKRSARSISINHSASKDRN